MNYILAYTLRNKTNRDSFKDNYIVYKDEDWDNNAIEKAVIMMNQLLDEEVGEDGWEVYTINIGEIILSTDHN